MLPILGGIRLHPATLNPPVLIANLSLSPNISFTPLKCNVLEFAGAFDLKHNGLPESQSPEYRPELRDRINRDLVQGVHDVACAEA